MILLKIGDFCFVDKGIDNGFRNVIVVRSLKIFEVC